MGRRAACPGQCARRGRGGPERRGDRPDLADARDAAPGPGPTPAGCAPCSTRRFTGLLGAGGSSSGLSETDFGTAAEALQEALGEPGTGGRLTRPEVFEVLRRAGVDPVGQRGYHVVSRLAQDGLLCQVAQTGGAADLRPARRCRRPTHPGARGRRWPPLRRATSAATPRRPTATSPGGPGRTSAGPGGARPRRPRPGRGGSPSPTDEPGQLHLLPGFDEYLLGYADRSHAGPPEALDGRPRPQRDLPAHHRRRRPHRRHLASADPRSRGVRHTDVAGAARPEWVSSLAEATTDYVRFVSGGPTSGGARRGRRVHSCPSPPSPP